MIEADRKKAQTFAALLERGSLYVQDGRAYVGVSGVTAIRRLIEVERAEAHAAGRREMREEAANRCSLLAVAASTVSDRAAREEQRFAYINAEATIRALPDHPEPQEKEAPPQPKGDET